MPCIPSDIRAEVEARLARNKELLIKAQNALEKGLDAAVESYRFDSGEGSQSAKYRDPNDLQTLINRLTATIQADQEFLGGYSVVTLTQRRGLGA